MQYHHPLNHAFIQVSTISTSPRLSNVKNFPTFLRPVASDISIAPGIVKLMQHFEWKHIAIITQEEDIFTLVNNDTIHTYCILCKILFICCIHIIVINKISDLSMTSQGLLSWPTGT